MATLYKLTGSYAQVQQMIEDGTEGLEDTLESIEGALSDKLESYAMVIRNIESDVEGLKAEEKRLADRRKVMENGVLRMRKSMQDSLSSTVDKKVVGEKFTFSIRKNPPALKVLDEKLIPKKFISTSTVHTINNKAIVEQLKAGNKVAGAELSQGESFQIK